MNGNKVFAQLSESKQIRTRALYQYDYGMEIILSGDVPDNIRAEFMDGDNTIPVQISADQSISIPDHLLKMCDDVVCYLVAYDNLENPKSRNTIHEIHIAVQRRPKPEDSEDQKI